MSDAPPAATASTVQTSNVPSFDCSKATTWAAQQICTNPALAAQDQTLAKLYSASLSNLTMSERRQLRKDQRGWILTRGSCQFQTDPIGCLKNSFSSRIAALSVPGAAISASNAHATAFGDPVSYCRAIGTGEHWVYGKPGTGVKNDPRYTGPEQPAWLVKAANPYPGAPYVDWRCERGRVLACVEDHDGQICQKGAYGVHGWMKNAWVLVSPPRHGK